MALYILYTYVYVSVYNIHMSLYTRKPGVMSPTTKTLICTDIHSSKSSTIYSWADTQFVIIETIISQCLHATVVHVCACDTESTYDCNIVLASIRGILYKWNQNVGWLH